MKKALIKLKEARELIRNYPIYKDGKNSFAKYSYFTPEKIADIVRYVSRELNFVCLYQFKADENGVFGLITFHDLDSDEMIAVETRASIPDIKATNKAQQYGGALTYNKRYAYTSLFDIAEGDADYDSGTEQQKTQRSIKR